MEQSASRRKQGGSTDNTNKRLLGLIVVILILSIAAFSFYVFFYTDVYREEEQDKDRGIEDTISPPEVNQAISLEVRRIHKKGMEDVMRKIGPSWKKKPSYHFVAVVDGEEWIGNNVNDWDTGYIGWESYRIVDDEQEKSTIDVSIVETKKILLWTIEEEVEGFRITYDFKTGRWHGDDSFNDDDGYGHINGDHYEIWFDVHQSDGDGDGIPYWWEVNKLHTHPKVDDSTQDPDSDGIPTDWEWKWGYDPFVFDNHSVIDPEKDGLSNLEEYSVRKWLADPYYPDIYIEVDFMEKGPRFGCKHVLFKESQWMLMDVFSEHGITVHIDDGWPGGPTNGGGEYLRYVEEYISWQSGVGSEFYKYHFADERKGVFRYMFIAHQAGWNYPQDYKLWPDVISIPCALHFVEVMFPPAVTPRLQRLSSAVAVLHELGHSLGLNPSYHEGIDNKSQVGRNDLPPFQKLIARFEAAKYWDNYESCMNYAKFGRYLLDYSDGSHGPHDSNDWSYIDLTYFQKTDHGF